LVGTRADLFVLFFRGVLCFLLTSYSSATSGSARPGIRSPSASAGSQFLPRPPCQALVLSGPITFGAAAICRPLGIFLFPPWLWLFPRALLLLAPLALLNPTLAVLPPRIRPRSGFPRGCPSLAFLSNRFFGQDAHSNEANPPFFPLCADRLVPSKSPLPFLLINNTTLFSCFFGFSFLRFSYEGRPLQGISILNVRRGLSPRFWAVDVIFC